MSKWTRLLVGALVCAAAACNAGGSGNSQSGFRLLEFREDGLNNLTRNHLMVFRFSADVLALQDFPERLKIQNVQSGNPSNFSLAIGTYLVNADQVTFVPRLPTKPDRTDGGFRENGEYVVFLKAGPDALASTSGSTIAVQQEFTFATNENFDDPIPTQPPRALGFVARDTTTNVTTDLGRLDPRPTELALLDSSELIQAGRVIDPGAGGGPTYPVAWQFELQVSEPLDPLRITPNNISMYEIYSDATTSGETAPPAAPPGWFGTPVLFKVPLTVTIRQSVDAQGVADVTVRVTPQGGLVDNTRYRLIFSGSILGIDFRKTFIGENGLTGDGQTVLPGDLVPYEEPGGLGYVTEFIVRDRASVTATRVLTYDPLVDGIKPEQGQTTTDETVFNSALYNPPSNPGTAVGFIGAFGSGIDGDLAVSGATIVTLDTGDTPNAVIGNPFTVIDPDPNDTYKNSSGFPASGPRTFDSFEPTQFDFSSVTVSSGSVLKIVGHNPCRITCAGLVQVAGTIDASGDDGGIGFQTSGNGVSTTPGYGGAGGPGGWAGGESSSPDSTFNCSTSNTCVSFDTYLACSAVNSSKFPWSKKGEGPGRGNQGGEVYNLGQQQNHVVNSNALTGTGGGGGSHATLGGVGDDKFNVSGNPGSPGKCVQWGIPNSSLIGLRGTPGPTYGDRAAFLVQMGGSGGGSGGAAHGWYNAAGGIATGGGGGGGGGFLEVLSAGPIIVTGTIDVTGGDGGKGGFNTQNGGTWTRVAGSGAGGSGGTLSLVSVVALNLTGGVIDASGGAGGAPPDDPASGFTNCNGCNGGGAGGRGFLFLMDPDGVVEGFTPIPMPGDNVPAGEYNSYSRGVLTLKPFDATRFGGISAVTELFSVRVANPAYQPLGTGDVLATVISGQSIQILVSSARPDVDNPLVPDLTTEIAAFEVAIVSFGGGSTTVDITGDMGDLNPGGTPNRDAFMRVIAIFNYSEAVQAAVGPYMSIDQVTTTFTYN